MNNNDIFKKLRVALMLRDDQIVDILQLVDFRISKGELGNFFRNADHPKFMECGDQVLRNFLNGLVIYLRGTKEDPKDPHSILESHKKTAETHPRFPKAMNTKVAGTANEKTKSKPAPKRILGPAKFNNGKPKKKDQ